VSVDAASTFGKKNFGGKNTAAVACASYRDSRTGSVRACTGHVDENLLKLACYDELVRRPSVCLSQHGPTAANPLLQVCCCGPGRQETSIDRCSSRCTVDAISVDWSIGATTAEKLEVTSRGVDTDPIPFSSSIPSPSPTVAPPLFHPFPSLLPGWDAPCIPRMLHGMKRFFPPPR